MRGRNCLSNASNCRFLAYGTAPQRRYLPSYNLVVVNAWIMPSVERNCLDVELK
jgi:hypothetical protein